MRLAAQLVFAVCSAAAAATPPHILFLMVDDLGYAGVGFNSAAKEPVTPTIDQLAKEGAILRQHYTYAFCSPTRSGFLSGRLPIHVNQINHPPNCPGGGVPAKMTTIPAVLAKAGYVSHHAGKWHGGMSHRNQLPINKGFNSSLAMLSGAADHFTNKRGAYVDMWLDDKPAFGVNGTYNCYSYNDHAINAVRAHDKSHPLFLYMAYQDVHEPVEAPEKYYAPYDPSIYKLRRGGLAQISAVDEAIANLTSVYKELGMWDNTLTIFSSDNGGPADHEANYPLRASKGSLFEGGVRVVAFVTGGWLPKKLRGTEIDAVIHASDWYATFAALAGVDPTDTVAAASGLPPIDSIDMSAVISGKNMTGPRTELALAFTDERAALIQGKYKLITGAPGNDFFPGPTTPNATPNGEHNTKCGDGCLFNLEEDFTEHHDIASSEPEVLAKMQARLKEIGTTVYQSPGSDKGDPAASTTAHEKYGDYWGPWEPDN